MISGIYAIQNMKNGNAYVGSSSDIKKRWSDHRRELIKGKHINKHLQSAWNKHSSDSFVWVILESVSDPSDLIAREQYWADELGAFGHGYNHAPCVDSPVRGVGHTEEVRKRISTAVKAALANPETRRKISTAVKAAFANPETRRKMSEARKGRSITEETLRRMNVGRTLSAERRRKMSELMCEQEYEAALVAKLAARKTKLNKPTDIQI